MDIQTKKPIVDKYGLLADDPKNGIKLIKTYDVIDWIESLKKRSSDPPQTLYQFNYVASTTPVSQIGHPYGMVTSAYFNNPIVFDPSYLYYWSDSNDVGGSLVTSKGTKMPFLTAVMKYADAEYRMYEGLIKNAHMTRNEALTYIDKYFEEAIGAAKLADSDDKDILNLFKNFTAEAREELAEKGSLLEFSENKAEELSKLGLLSKKTTAKGKTTYGKGVTLITYRSRINGLNVTNALGHGVISRGSADAVNNDADHKAIIDFIKSDEYVNDLPKSCMGSFRTYNVNNIVAYGTFKVNAFTVTDWDTFQLILNWYQEHDIIKAD